MAKKNKIQKSAKIYSNTMMYSSRGISNHMDFSRDVELTESRSWRDDDCVENVPYTTTNAQTNAQTATSSDSTSEGFALSVPFRKVIRGQRANLCKLLFGIFLFTIVLVVIFPQHKEETDSIKINTKPKTGLKPISETVKKSEPEPAAPGPTPVEKPSSTPNPTPTPPPTPASTPTPTQDTTVVRKSGTTQSGDGVNFPKKRDIVTIHYTGYLDAKGTVFDSSRHYGTGEEFSFEVDKKQEVLDGWHLGIRLLSLGEKAKIHMPSKFAFGPEGFIDIVPPNSDLTFDVELFAIDGCTKITNSGTLRDCVHCFDGSTPEEKTSSDSTVYHICPHKPKSQIEEGVSVKKGPND